MPGPVVRLNTLGLIDGRFVDLSGYQPLDSDLTAIAALTTTSYGRDLLALADAAAGRTALGLGTAATTASTAYDAAGSAASAQAAAIAASQPVDADLTAIAALTTTAYGRALLALADAAALRTAVGVDGSVVLSAAMLELVQGSPATTNVTGGAVRWRVWLLDAAAQEGVAGIVRVPSWATSMAMSVRWAATTADTTNAVVWSGSRGPLTDGTALTTTGGAFTGGNTTATCNGQHVPVTTALGTASVTGSTDVGVQIARVAANAGDTYTADAEVVALAITFT